MIRLALALGFILAFSLDSPANPDERCSLWLDLYRGEPVAWDELIEDLTGVDMVFLGEAHRVQRHHDLQKQIVNALAKSGKRVLLGIEQMEGHFTESLERYNQGELEFDDLAEEIGWGERWSNYADYQPVLDAVLMRAGRVVALNAKAETIRAIARNSLGSLTEEQRSELPETLDFDEPMYENLLNKLLLVHMAFSEDMLKNVYHAQVARDETMAERMAAAWKSLDDPDEWIGVIICGSGHCSYGLGMPSRLERRLPDLKQRIVLMTESGDTVLTEAEKAMKRDIELTHEDLRFLNRPIADYLHAIEMNPDAQE